MRTFALLSICLTIALPSIARAQGQLLTPPTGAAADTTKTASYGIGYDIGRNLGAGGITSKDILKEEILRGLSDALDGKDPEFELQAFQTAMQELGKKILARKLDANKKFLEENKKKDGFQTMENGLQYKVLKSGTGAAPTASSQVTVHYEGKLINGQIFDSSIKREMPATFGVSQVIPGWTQALLRMKVGDKWQLVIPSELGYGERGSPPDQTGRQAIGPHQILLFEVELLEVK